VELGVMKEVRVVPIAERHIAGFRAAVDSVAREKRYLAMLRGFPLKGTRQFVRANIKNRNPHFVALDGPNVVGWCDILRVERHAMAHSGVLGIGLVKGYREKGIGRALIDAALARARKTGFTRVELTVREDNLRGIRLYRKVGFVPEGRKRNAFRVDGRYYDLLTMAVLFKRSKA
jgi:RimJ/RimL family protein N-acetyltransferase